MQNKKTISKEKFCEELGKLFKIYRDNTAESESVNDAVNKAMKKLLHASEIGDGFFDDFMDYDFFETDPEKIYEELLASKKLIQKVKEVEKSIEE